MWATYSVLSRRFAARPSDAVAGFCLATAALCRPLSSGVRTTVWPADAGQWLAVIGLGLAPVGAAFYAWDFGVKRGDIRVLGAASYAAPVLSTLLLVLTGYTHARWSLALAALLIAGGGLIAAKDLLVKPAPQNRRGKGGSDQGGDQSFGAISKPVNANPGATVQPTRVQSPRLSAACQAPTGTRPAGARPPQGRAPGGPCSFLPSCAIWSASGAPA